MTEAVSNMVESLKPDQEQPILTADLPCPQCGYNLRGLPASRCPECGTPFDPEQLRRLYQAGREAPPLAWILPNMLRHPVAFWRMPAVQFTAGPSPQQVFTILAGALYTALIIHIAISLTSGTSPWMNDRPSTVTGMLHMLAVLPLALAGMWLVLIVHAALAQVFVPKEAQAPSPLRCGGHILSSDPVVGYAAVWAIPAVTCLLSLEGRGPSYLFTLIRGGDFLLMLKSVPWAPAFGAVLATSCVMWAVALYQGGRIVAGGRKWPAIWYAACNPFWLVVVMFAMW